MRICDLLKELVDAARLRVPHTTWTICVSPAIQAEIERELEVPFLGELHGEILLPTQFEDDDVILVLPGVRSHLFTSEEALSLERLRTTGHKIGRYYLPPEHLTAGQVEIYQVLRFDGMNPMQAAAMAILI